MNGLIILSNSVLMYLVSRYISLSINDLSFVFFIFPPKGFFLAVCQVYVQKKRQEKGGFCILKEPERDSQYNNSTSIIPQFKAEELLRGSLFKYEYT